MNITNLQSHRSGRQTEQVQAIGESTIRLRQLVVRLEAAERAAADAKRLRYEVESAKRALAATIDAFLESTVETFLAKGIIQ